MENKKMVKQFIDNLFVDNNKAYEVLAENVRVNWPGFGMEDIVGKENLRSFLDDGGPEEVVSQSIHNIIEEGHTVIADGTMITRRKGILETSHFADIYKIQDGKISSLISYMILDKSNPDNL